MKRCMLSLSAPIISRNRNHRTIMSSIDALKPKLTLIERILALDRSSELAHQYTPLILFHPNQALNGVNNLKSVVELSSVYVAVGLAQTSLVNSALLHCKDDNDKPIFVKDRIPNSHGIMTDVLQLYMDTRVRDDVNNDRCRYDYRQLFQKRTEAFEYVADYLILTGVIPRRHTDLYPIYPFMDAEDRANDKTVLAHINRNTAPCLGIDSVGVHLNCYVKENNRIGGVWLAKRASTKSHHFGYWDCTVAGGHPINLSLVDNIVKESQEEAGVPAEWILHESSMDDDSDTLFSDNTHDPLMITTAKSDGTCMKQSLYYSCDLQVPHNWTPTPVDGEVSEFRLYSITELENELRYGNIIRPSIRAVLLDFMIRHEQLRGEDNIHLLRDAMRRGRLLLW